MVSDQPEASGTAPAAQSSAPIATPNSPAATAGTTPSLGELSERDKFVIDCLRDARYHEDRERYFARIHRSAMFVVVASGTATFAWVKAAPALTAILTLAGLLDLVFDVSGKARLHASLRRRVYDLLAQAEDPKRSIETLREQAVRIYADEPPCMHAANMIAYNGAMDALHRPRAFMYKIEWYHRWLRHVWSFQATDFKTFGQLAEERSAA